MNAKAPTEKIKTHRRGVSSAAPYIKVCLDIAKFVRDGMTK